MVSQGFFLTIFTLVIAVFLMASYEPLSTTERKAERRVHLNDTRLDYNYCRSSGDVVDAETGVLLNILNKITAQPYFRYFKVNSGKQCPYWAVSLLCTSSENTCDVCKCDENDIPEALRVSEDMSTVETPSSSVTQMSPFPSNLDEFGEWKLGDTGAEYVDLPENPEGNTGYSGPLAAQVWRAIYQENCLTQHGENHCKEVSVLRTLLSGLHMSINMHVCTNFYKDPDFKSPQYSAGIYNSPRVSFFPNCDMFNKRVQPFPEFIENLYVLYQFTLRALSKTRSLLLQNLNAFNSGLHGTPTPGDLELHTDISELFESRLLCVQTFDEGLFLESQHGRELVPQFKDMMVNVTHLMDCVTCEKCRIWGKLESKGIAVAMKINMNPENNTISLDRSEIVTLVNLARQLAFSVYNVQHLSKTCATENQTKE